MAPVVFVAGARPNFMKIAPILAANARRGRPIADVLVHTGQHYDPAMSSVFFDELGIRAPDAYLEVGSGSHGAQTGRIMTAFEDYLARSERPRGVVVVGDVNSTMACALVAVKLGIPVAHVEAGLRSGDRAMPEEINRLVTDTVADLLLVSEPAGMTNLAAEGIAAHRVRYVGNVMIDTLVAQLPHATPHAGGHALVTLHRPSNVDDPVRLRALVAFLGELGDVVFPVHPRTRAKLDALGVALPASVRVLPPLGYRAFVGLMASARVVVTDSGGVQEETTHLGVPCVTLRTTTERPVTITHGTNVLVGEDLGAARAAIARAAPGAKRPIDGWDGRAAERVIDELLAAWG